MNRLIFAILLLAVSFFSYVNAAISIRADISADSTYADSVISVTAERLHKLIGPAAPDTIEMYIVTSPKGFDSLTAGTIPDWGAGVAIPYLRRIVIKSPLILPGDKSLGELVAHEYTHMALDRRLDFQDAPRWLHEGMAMYFSAEWSWENNLAIGWAVITGTTIPLEEIEYLNRFSTRKAEAVYAESYLAFKYFLDTYGSSGLGILLNCLRDGRSFDDSFIAAVGGDYQTFDKEFADFLSGRYNLVIVLFSSEIFWIVLALLFIVAIVSVRLRRRRRLDELERYDQLHSTDFDYGRREQPDEDDRWN